MCCTTVLSRHGGGGGMRNRKLERGLECMAAHFDGQLDWVSDIEAISDPLCL